MIQREYFPELIPLFDLIDESPNWVPTLVCDRNGGGSGKEDVVVVHVGSDSQKSRERGLSVMCPGWVREGETGVGNTSSGPSGRPTTKGNLALFVTTQTQWMLVQTCRTRSHDENNWETEEPKTVEGWGTGCF